MSAAPAALVMQHHRQQRFVNLDFAVVFDKASLRNLFMKKLTRDRVVPTISASVSWETFGKMLSGRSWLP
jgi:hypothetical protein